MSLTSHIAAENLQTALEKKILRYIGLLKRPLAYTMVTHSFHLIKTVHEGLVTILFHILSSNSIFILPDTSVCKYYLCGLKQV